LASAARKLDAFEQKIVRVDVDTLLELDFSNASSSGAARFTQTIFSSAICVAK
jgi:hypothetical protein